MRKGLEKEEIFDVITYIIFKQLLGAIKCEEVTKKKAKK